MLPRGGWRLIYGFFKELHAASSGRQDIFSANLFPKSLAAAISSSEGTNRQVKPFSKTLSLRDLSLSQSMGTASPLQPKEPNAALSLPLVLMASTEAARLWTGKTASLLMVGEPSNVP